MPSVHEPVVVSTCRLFEIRTTPTFDKKNDERDRQRWIKDASRVVAYDSAAGGRRAERRATTAAETDIHRRNDKNRLHVCLFLCDISLHYQSVHCSLACLMLSKHVPSQAAHLLPPHCVTTTEVTMYHQLHLNERNNNTFIVRRRQFHRPALRANVSN
jgi:hypothetical protein